LKPIWLEDRYLNSDPRLRRLLAVADKARERVVVALSEAGKLGNRPGGGAFAAAIFRAENAGESVGPETMGNISEEKVPIYIRCCAEKLLRTLVRMLRCSFMDADEKKWQYGGAIRLLEFVLSFSAFPPDADEAVGILTTVWSFGSQMTQVQISNLRRSNEVLQLIPDEELVERSDLWPAESVAS